MDFEDRHSNLCYCVIVRDRLSRRRGMDPCWTPGERNYPSRRGVQARPGHTVWMVSSIPATSESSRERADGRHGGTQVTGAVRTGDWRHA